MKNDTDTPKNDRGELICPIEISANIIGGKWKVKIIWELMAGKRRFGELLHNIPGGISQKVLTDSLRELERDGIITRTVYPEVPPRVEYELSELGLSATPVMGHIEFFGLEYYRKMNPGKKFHTKRDIVPDKDLRSKKSYAAFLAKKSDKLSEKYLKLSTI